MCASFLFSAWGYASRKRFGTAALLYDELAFYNKIMGQNYVFIVERGMLNEEKFYLL